ncbi:hypothetical protein K0651_13350 [Ornithinimicrobium sp. Arc0846-15]|nr:hypothetical protein [Ornithinimicrobium laminariae]
MAEIGTPQEYVTYSDTVLYDVFYESGTMLGGKLQACMRAAEAIGDVGAIADFKAESIAARQRRAAVDAYDRDEQVRVMIEFQTRRVELKTVLERLRSDG